MPAMNVEIFPERTDDPGAVLALMERDGAVILTGVEPTAEASIEVARAVLGPAALDVRFQFGIELPVMVALKEIFTFGTFDIPDGRFGEHTETVRGWTEFFTQFLASRPVADHTETLPAHVDGYALGDAAPDYIFQIFAQQSDEGGESVLLDGVALVEQLASDPEQADLAAFLAEVPIDQTEKGLTPCFGTVLQTGPTGRLRIVRHGDQAPHPDGDATLQQAMIDRWQALVDQLTNDAVGVKVNHGEALCLDNYRLMHARRPYEDIGRELFVSWGWTADAIALPSSERLTFAGT